MKKTIYIAYGSNMNVAQMAQRCHTAVKLGSAVLTDYKLVYRGGPGGAVATVEPHTGGAVPVGVWQLEPADERALDRYEGWPSFYRKETVKVKFNGRLRNVMVYIMNPGRKINMPSHYYFATIYQGYEDFGFDKEDLWATLPKKRTGSVKAKTSEGE